MAAATEPANQVKECCWPQIALYSVQVAASLLTVQTPPLAT